MRLGVGLGILAGILFALAEVLVAALMGNPPLMPIRMFASVVMGPSALDTASPAVAILGGIIAHLVLSIVFGVIYTAMNARAPLATKASTAQQAAIGLGFGALIWLLDFQIIARLIYPWFLGAPQLLQLVLHAVFFGLPLGLMYAGAHRRVGARPEAEAPA